MTNEGNMCSSNRSRDWLV